MILKKAILQVSKSLNIDLSVVSKIYNEYYHFFLLLIKSIPFKDIDTEEEFNKYRTSFNLPYLGKLGCSYKRLKGLKKKYAKDFKI